MASGDYVKAAWHPQTEAERQQIRDQLKNLLVSPHFANSKRYPNLLRYVVEQTLEGNDDQLKERTLGVEVFNRPADYDTNQDPVVRLSAAEVRKRLALYYQQPDHQQKELMIGLSPGSYVPYFAPAPSAGSETIEEDVTPGLEPARTISRRSIWLFAAAIGLAGVLALSLGWHVLFPPPVAEQFWSPLLASSGRVTLCVGAPDEMASPTDNVSSPPTTLYDEIRSSGRLGTANVVTLIHVGAALTNYHKAFRLALASQASFPELREGPVVLVGAMDNTWTMRLTQSLRYGFAMDDKMMYVVDHKNPTARNWSVSLTQRPSSLSTDFAVIARYHDPTLDQPVVLAAGLSRQGTEAASEILSNADFLKMLFQKSPRNWKTVNLEAVVQTEVIDGHPGPSHIVAIEYW